MREEARRKARVALGMLPKKALTKTQKKAQEAKNKALDVSRKAQKVEKQVQEALIKAKNAENQAKEALKNSKKKAPVKGSKFSKKPSKAQRDYQRLVMKPKRYISSSDPDGWDGWER